MGQPSTDRTSRGAPPAIEAAARARSDARAARDWPTADRLRDEIEAAGWRVVDAGTDYRLEPASPPDVEVGGEIRYGRSDAVPSLLDEPATAPASVIIVASPDMEQTRAALQGLRAAAPVGVEVVIVADGLSDRTLEPLRPDLATGQADAGERSPIELIRTSEQLGHAAALNAGIRRARGSVVVVLDPSIVPTGDVVTPLVGALADPAVAIAGPFGLWSEDLRRFEESVAARPAAAVQGYLMAFRRADFTVRGPLDEAFRFYRNLDIWWSLVLRDEGEDATPRSAVIVADLPLERGEPHAWTSTPPAERDRRSKRNFYRVLDRFRTRLDLAG